MANGLAAIALNNRTSRDINPVEHGLVDHLADFQCASPYINVNGCVTATLVPAVVTRGSNPPFVLKPKVDMFD
jgi:hypothetical protein